MSSDTIGKNKEPEASESQYLTSEFNERLCAICPTPKRCMVTLESAENNPIEICHILAHQTKGDLLDLLERHWAMKNLDINMPENLTFMRVDMHRSFDKGDWVLFPEKDLLNKISQTYLGNRSRISYNRPPIDLFQEFKEQKKKKPFRYQLVWLEDINASTNPPILRRRLPPALKCGVMPAGGVTNPASTQVKKHKKRSNATLEAEIAALQLENVALRERLQENQEGMTTRSKSAKLPRNSPNYILPNYQVYLPPYTDFPVIESHIHPLLVIFNAGEKLCGRVNLHNLDIGTEVEQAAMIIIFLYELWMTKLPRDVKPQNGHQGDDNDDKDGGKKDGGDGEEGGDDDGEDNVREDDHDDNTRGENADNHDEGSRHGRGEEGHHGDSSKPQEYTEKHCKPQGVQNAAELPRNYSTHFHTSTGTPELIGGDSGDSRGGAVELSGVQSEDAGHDSDSSNYGDLDRWIAEWAASAEPESDIKLLTNDHQLKGYRKEPARQPPFEQWQHWAHSPPEMPNVIHDHDDTSHYTSYLWSLYHRDVNLLAPDGCPYRIPKPWNRHLRS